MAEQKKNELEQEDQESQEEAPARKKIPINLIIISILVLCLIGGGIYVWKSGIISSSSDETALESQGGDSQEMGPIYSLETFIVNLVGGRGKNYLKAKVELELDSDKTTVEINKRLPQIRDAILTMLSSKSNEDISTLEGKFQLRAEIISTLNQFLKTGRVKNVFFTDFIVQ